MKLTSSICVREEQGHIVVAAEGSRSCMIAVRRHLKGHAAHLAGCIDEDFVHEERMNFLRLGRHGSNRELSLERDCAGGFSLSAPGNKANDIRPVVTRNQTSPLLANHRPFDSPVPARQGGEMDLFGSGGPSR